MPDPKNRHTRTALGIGALVVAAVVIVLWLMLPRPPSPRTAPSALSGDAVRSVLLDGTELTGMLGQSFGPHPDDPAYGGLEQMDDSASGECAGVVDAAVRDVYRPFDVRGFARETWVPAEPQPSGDAPPNKLMFVKESVVALPSAEDARAAFERLTEQWRACDGRPSDQGRTAPHEPPLLPGTQTHITGVRITDTVLSASITLDNMPDIPDVRAIGVQDNCIVGVLLPFTRIEDPTAIPDPQESAVDVVRAMMSRVAAQLN